MIKILYESVILGLFIKKTLFLQEQELSDPEPLYHKGIKDAAEDLWDRTKRTINNPEDAKTIWMGNQDDNDHIVKHVLPAVSNLASNSIPQFKLANMLRSITNREYEASKFQKYRES